MCSTDYVSEMTTGAVRTWRTSAGKIQTSPWKAAILLHLKVYKIWIQTPRVPRLLENFRFSGGPNVSDVFSLK